MRMGRKATGTITVTTTASTSTTITTIERGPQAVVVI
jgi:hypothetical protein